MVLNALNLSFLGAGIWKYIKQVKLKNSIQPCDADCLYCFDFNPLDVYNKTGRRSWNHSCEQGLRAEISTLEDSS